MAGKALRFIGIAALTLTSCDLGSLQQKVVDCTEVCGKVDECQADPPALQIGTFTQDTNVGAIDCAANCAQENRAFYGYSDCQIECINGVTCDQIQDCWKSDSAIYAEYCLASRDIPPVTPDKGDPTPDNGTTTGSSDADEIVDDPAVEVAVDDGDFDVNYGDTPPDIAGLYGVQGSIDQAANARPVGSEINTAICFWGQQSLDAGSELNYCESGVPGIATAPVTGSGSDFTIYLLYPEQATILFSGSVNAQGGVDNAEAMVVYLHGVDIWEHSFTDWVNRGDCSGCN